MFKHSLNMEIIKQVQKWGNSAGILLPKEWLGKEVQIVLIDRTSEIKEEIFDILDKSLEEVIGIYLTGSYARNEQKEDSDIDVIVISKSIRKEIVSGKYHISIIPLETIKKALKKYPISIFPRLIEAKPIINNSLLEELKKTKIRKNSFKEFIKETERIIKINEGLLKIDKEKKEILDSNEIIYSLILRLRGIFLIKNMMDKISYSNKLFLKHLMEEIKDEEVDKVYKIYKSIKNNKKIKEKIRMESAEKLLDLLKKDIQPIKWQKERKDSKKA